MKVLKNIYKKADKLVLFAVLILIIAFLVNLISIYSTSSEIGSFVGKSTGTLAGNFLGSFNGYVEGTEQAKRDAENSKVNIQLQDSLSGMSELEILVIDLDYLDVYKSNDSLDPDYAYAFSESVRVSFTVDMTAARVDETNGYIIIPDVVCSAPATIDGTFEIYKDKIYQKNSNAGSTTDAIQKESDNHKQLLETIQKKIDASYRKRARDSAKERIENLAYAVSGKEISVIIDVQEED